MNSIPLNLLQKLKFTKINNNLQHNNILPVNFIYFNQPKQIKTNKIMVYNTNNLKARGQRSVRVLCFSGKRWRG